MQKETWVGIAWAVGLFAAMAGVFAYEAATFEFDEFDVAYNETVQEATHKATLNAGASSSKTIDVNTTNLTFVRFHLSWADNSGANADSFSVTMTNGTGASVTFGPSSSGSLSGSKVLVALPGHDHIEGVSLEDAKSRSNIGVGNVSAAGNEKWTFKVTLNSAPPTAAGGAAPNPNSCDFATNNNCDGSEAFTLHIEWGNYKAVFGADARALMDMDGSGDAMH